MESLHIFKTCFLKINFILSAYLFQMDFSDFLFAILYAFLVLPHVLYALLISSTLMWPVISTKNIINYVAHHTQISLIFCYLLLGPNAIPTTCSQRPSFSVLALVRDQDLFPNSTPIAVPSIKLTVNWLTLNIGIYDWKSEYQLTFTSWDVKNLCEILIYRCWPSGL